MIEGSLSEASVLDIVQFCCRNREQVRVILSYEERVGTIHFADGKVVHAMHGNSSGKEALHQLLRWQEGFFTVMVENKSPSRTVYVSDDELVVLTMQKFNEVEKHADEIKTDVDKTDSKDDLPHKFGPILQELADDLDGFLAVYVVNNEGDVLTSLVVGESIDEESESTELNKIARKSSQAIKFANLGQFEEMIIITDTHQFIIWSTEQNHYIELVLTPDSSIGAARMYLENIIANRS